MGEIEMARKVGERAASVTSGGSPHAWEVVEVDPLRERSERFEFFGRPGSGVVAGGAAAAALSSVPLLFAGPMGVGDVGFLALILGMFTVTGVGAFLAERLFQRRFGRVECSRIVSRSLPVWAMARSAAQGLLAADVPRELRRLAAEQFDVFESLAGVEVELLRRLQVLTSIVSSGVEVPWDVESDRLEVLTEMDLVACQMAEVAATLDLVAACEAERREEERVALEKVNVELELEEMMLQSAGFGRERPVVDTSPLMRHLVEDAAYRKARRQLKEH